MVGCVQAVVGKKRFLVQFEDGQKKEMSYCSLVFLCSKEEVEMDEPLSNSPEKGQGEFCIIDGNPEVEEPCMFGRGVYFMCFSFCVMLRIYLRICWKNRCQKREIQT